MYKSYVLHVFLRYATCRQFDSEAIRLDFAIRKINVSLVKQHEQFLSIICYHIEV